MRDGKNTDVVRAMTEATCGDCGAESMAENPWRWARSHTDETGHITTVQVTYDIFKKCVEY